MEGKACESFTDVEEIPVIVKDLRKTFRTGKTLSLAWRKQQLNQLVALLKENKDEFVNALRKDLQSIDIIAESEVEGPLKEAKLALQNLPKWMKPEPRSVPLLNKPGSGYIVKEPYGLVLIISPWNYPVSLILKPLVGAIAAGNCCVLKPSEVSENVSHLLATLIPKYLDNNCIRVVEGAVVETQALLKEVWDYIFYTGNGAVGKVVMRAAAENLTPLTLELGGKSPAIVDSTVNIDVATRRLCWGKFTVNAGQTCVAPDYILVTKDVEKKFLEKMKSTLDSFYGKSISDSKDFSRIINERHVARIGKLLEGQNIVCGGDVDAKNKYVSPTIVSNVDPNSPLMQEEIFGPVLPVLAVESIDAAIDFVNSRPKPLALYVFSSNKQTQDKIINSTFSGGVAVNDVVLQVVCPDLPFGGVGPSGMGAYNGESTFTTFTHRKSVLSRPTWGDASLRYPPYTPAKIKWLKRINGFKPNGWLVIALVLAPVLAFLMFKYYNTITGSKL